MTELLLFLVFLSVFLLIINKLSFFHIEGIPKLWVIAAFGLKILASLALFIIYTRYYTDRSTADIFKYFDDSKVMYQAFFTSPSDFLKMITGIGNDTPHFSQYYNQMNHWYGIYPSNIYGDGHLMIRINALLRFISHGTYHVHSLILCFLSFTGLIALYKVFSKHQNDKKRLLFLFLFIFPSILIWSSGILKEGLLFFAIGMILYLFDSMSFTKFNPYKIAAIILFILFLRYTRFYIFVLLLPLLITDLWCRIIPGRRVWVRYIMVIVIFLVSGIILGVIFPDYDFIKVISRKQHDFLALAEKVNAGSILTSEPLEASWPGILKEFIPGFLRAIFVPYPWDIRNIMMIIPAVENIFLICFFLFSLTGFKFRPANTSIYWFSVLFFVFVFTVTGTITPVAGALVRYKVIAIPFLIHALFLTWNKEKSIHYLFKK